MTVASCRCNAGLHKAPAFHLGLVRSALLQTLTGRSPVEAIGVVAECRVE